MDFGSEAAFAMSDSSHSDSPEVTLPKNEALKTFAAFCIALPLFYALVIFDLMHPGWQGWFFLWAVAGIFVLGILTVAWIVLGWIFSPLIR